MSVFPSGVFLVPSLLALYDTMNDDEEEIRDTGASVVSRILGSCLTPLAACRKFLQWICQNFGESETFSIAVVQRITDSSSLPGTELEPVENQLAVAMLDDDSLFVEEEQNLYIDEVRESIAWNSVLMTAEGALWDEAARRLSLWVLDGLVALTRLSQSEDGPYGWASKPTVFACCMRVVLTTKVVLARFEDHLRTGGRVQLQVDSEGMVAEYYMSNMGQTRERLRDAVRSLLETGCANNLHPILLDELGKLVYPNLSIASP